MESVKTPVITVTGIGKVSPLETIEERKVMPGQELVVTKWIGMEGALLVVNSKEEQLKERYAFQLLENVKSMEQNMMVLSEAATAIKSGATAMHDLSEGGILAALWEFGQKHGVGLEIHEKPALAPSNTKKLQVGNIVTVEPGIYIPGKFGVRIEDLAVITEKSCENLTKITKELVKI